MLQVESHDALRKSCCK